MRVFPLASFLVGLAGLEVLWGAPSGLGVGSVLLTATPLLPSLVPGGAARRLILQGACWRTEEGPQL